MTNWTRASTTLKEHAISQTHVESVKDAAQFQTTQPAVAQLVAVQNDNVISTNTRKLRSILECAIFCARQNIGLRGHRNEEYNPESGERPTRNPGNFLSLLHFRAESGDQALREHFTLTGKGPKNVTYRTPRVQNELLECAGKFLQDKILHDIRRRGIFSLCADEAADCSNQEQMAVVVRFVDPDTLDVREEFMDFLLFASGTTGRALADMLLGWLEDKQLDKSKVRGQCYDGASNMSGRLQGAASLIKESCGHLAEYMHCNAHVLNLCVIATSKVKAVQNMWGVLKELSLFFDNSPKRQSQFENVASEEDTPNRRKKLVQLCRTRWVARHTSLSTFRQLYSVVVTTLDIIANEEGWNAESSSKASGFLAAVTSFPFLVAFLITWRGLEYCQVCLFSFIELLKCFCDHALSGWVG